MSTACSPKPARDLFAKPVRVDARETCRSFRGRWFGPDQVIAGLLLLVTVALYARTVRFSFIDFDDGSFFANNTHLLLGLTPAGLRWALSAHDPNWCPVVSITYLMLARFFGRTPGAPHGFNALVHGLNAALLFWFWLRATGLRWPSAVAAALWAWHPLRVESVAWVSETKDVLSCLFWITAMLLYTRYARRPGWGAYLAVSVAFLLSLASKPTAVTLPAALLLLDVWPLQRVGGGGMWVRVIEKLPWVALAVVLSLTTVSQQDNSGALQLNHTFPLPVRLANAVTSYTAYLAQTFWPTHLAVFYPYPNSVGRVISPSLWGGATVLLLAISTLAVLARRGVPALFVGWFWFLGVAVPMIGLVQAGLQARADRYTLIPSIGLVAAIVFPVAAWVRQAPRLRFVPAVTLAGLLAVAEFFAASVQIATWRSNRMVFEHANAVTSRNYLAASELASEYAGSEATRPLALQLAKESLADCPHVIYGYSALAAVYEAAGEWDKALLAYTACAKLEPGRPASWENQGNIEVKADQFAAAEAHFRRALQIDPMDFTARDKLAICLAHGGQMDQAIAEWQRVVRDCPQLGDAQGWLAEALRLQGNRAGAEAHYRAAREDGEHRPGWEINEAWLVAIDPGSTATAVEQVMPAAVDAVEQSGAPDPLALDALAAVYARCGQFDQAVSTARRGVLAAQADHRSALAQAIERRGAVYAQGRAWLIPR